MTLRNWFALFLVSGSLVTAASIARVTANDPPTVEDPTKTAIDYIRTLDVKPTDWPLWGGSPARNNVPEATGLPTEWDIASGTNVLWSAKVGSETYGNPVVANGKLYIGTNNGSGYIERYPSKVDLGCLICFDSETGEFLWQHSNEKLPTGRVHDWPDQGVCAAPLVDGEKLWYVSNRGEVVCLDTEGFRDGENDGPFVEETPVGEREADVIWKLNMMKELGVSQHNMCSCSVMAVGDMLFVITGNGVDEGHIELPAESAPSFICVSRSTGKVLWTDNTPGNNVLHGQWSSPAYGVFDGVEQVIFGGGDGYVYSFEPKGENGKGKLLWKFDCNPKDSLYVLGGRATRNHLIATPVIYDGKVYVAVGEDPEHGEGPGHLWCIDPTKRGDVSPSIVYNSSDPEVPAPHRRLQAMKVEEGDFQRDNPNSAAIWHYVGADPEEFETTMHRTCGTVAIKNDLLFVVDFSGVVHCVNAQTGEAHWTHDMLSASWASALIADDKVYMGNEYGDVLVFALSAEKELLATNVMDTAVYTTPIAAGNTIYIANRNRVFAIREGATSESE
ncbi:MAG TPA: serine/threonine protein kinase [Planctomycetaceae bacterium]|nr:serine/threonine protein kinase [Planctomycetaceae bacterium]HRF02655.1 PQQ-binding-like beta-propeller repeat protein [Pirellulaceae bacterium]